MWVSVYKYNIVSYSVHLFWLLINPLSVFPETEMNQIKWWKISHDNLTRDHECDQWSKTLNCLIFCPHQAEKAINPHIWEVGASEYLVSMLHIDWSNRLSKLLQVYVLPKYSFDYPSVSDLVVELHTHTFTSYASIWDTLQLCKLHCWKLKVYCAGLKPTLDSLLFGVFFLAIFVLSLALCLLDTCCSWSDTLFMKSQTSSERHGGTCP